MIPDGGRSILQLDGELPGVVRGRSDANNRNGLPKLTDDVAHWGMRRLDATVIRGMCFPGQAASAQQYANRRQDDRQHAGGNHQFQHGHPAP